MTTTTTTAPHPVVTAATNLMSVLWVAEYRELPMPFAVRAFEHTGPRQIVLQFHTRAAVETWAAAMDTEADAACVASGFLLDVPVTVCAYVSGGAS